VILAVSAAACCRTLSATFVLTPACLSRLSPHLQSLVISHVGFQQMNVGPSVQVWVFRHLPLGSRLVADHPEDRIVGIAGILAKKFVLVKSTECQNTLEALSGRMHNSTHPDAPRGPGDDVGRHGGGVGGLKDGRYVVCVDTVLGRSR
jgi:hypothetical protein